MSEMPPAKSMTLPALCVEVLAREREWKVYHSDDFEGHCGSPGEWLVERMDELDTEIRRRGHVPPVLATGDA